MYDIITQYGIYAITLVLSGLSWLVARYLLKAIEAKAGVTIAGYVDALWNETNAAVLEVAQTYVDGIKAGRADGNLTDEEKAKAKADAIAIAKSNLGTKGLKRLAKVFNIDSWVGTRIEAFLKSRKDAIPVAVALPPKQ